MIEELRVDGYEIFVDREDLPTVKVFKWRVWKTPRPYAVTRCISRNISMHRLLMGDPQGYVVDHINGNGLDNRRKNLRIVTQHENVVNSLGWMKHKRRFPCPYKGVWRISRFGRNRSGKRYESKVMIEGRQRYLGCFETMEEAAMAYDSAVRVYLPRTAYLNFPREGER